MKKKKPSEGHTGVVPEQGKLSGKADVIIIVVVVVASLREKNQFCIWAAKRSGISEAGQKDKAVASEPK